MLGLTEIDERYKRVGKFLWWSHYFCVLGFAWHNWFMTILLLLTAVESLVEPKPSVDHRYFGLALKTGLIIGASYFGLATVFGGLWLCTSMLYQIFWH